jgi:hypothetical protein
MALTAAKDWLLFSPAPQRFFLGNVRWGVAKVPPWIAGREGLIQQNQTM